MSLLIPHTPPSSTTGTKMPATNEDRFNLSKAADSNHIDTMRTILDNVDIDVNQYKDMWGNTALHKASVRGNAAAIELLLNHQADANALNHDKNTPLYTANRNLPSMELLLSHGANINAVNKYGNTVLHIAALNGNPECIEFLLKHHANVNALNNYGDSPLHWSSGNGSSFELLLKYGANVNAVSRRVSSSLHMMIRSGKKVATELLVNYQADIAFIDSNGKTPLHTACDNDQWDLYTSTLLINHQADVYAVDKNGDTPLIRACCSGRMDIVKYLISKGSHINHKNYNGKTALQYAREQNNHFLAEHLESLLS